MRSLPRASAFVRLPLILAVLSSCSGDVIDPHGDGDGNGGGGGGGGGGGPGSVQMVEIKAADFEYRSTYFSEPGLLEVSLGSTVSWVSDSGIPHTVTPVGHEEWEKATGSSKGQLILEHKFDRVGTFDYRCDFHWEQGMTGRVSVLP